MKLFKKSLCLVLCFILAFSLAAPSFADEAEPYPFIFVHGFLGWGAGSDIEVSKPYWGDTQENNVMTYLRDKGYSVYNPSVGPMGSSWDRACDLFAQLTGTRVDYGEAHSTKFGHERYGRDYTGKPTMGSAWDLESKLNLVGHSFGGATVRYFASLMAYGDADEIAASGENCSELFKGGHADAIYSVTTLAAPSNGSTLSDFAESIEPISAFMAYYFAKSSYDGSEAAGGVMDVMIDHWGLTAAPGEEKIKPSFLKAMKFALSDDECGYDMSVAGALELNKKIKTVPSVYYFSYAANITSADKLGYYHIDTDTPVFEMFKFTAPIVSLSVNKFAGGIFIDKSWGQSDGMVSLVSAQYPIGDGSEHCNYSEAEEIETGIWYVMPTLEGVDHYDFCSAAETGEFGSKQAYFDFFENLIKNVYELGA